VKITEDLYYYEEVLDNQFCHELFNESLTKFNNGEACWASNYFWNGPLTKDTHPIFIRDIEGETKHRILETLRQKEMIVESDDYYSVMNYVATRLSYIPWHNDIPYKEGLTIYLNPVWFEDWGGIYLYKPVRESNLVSGFIPKFNTAIKNTGGGTTKGVDHTVTLVSLASQCPRISIQIFPKVK
jgi:hypothetical protein